MRDICRCWEGASESPNQATFETFTSRLASGNWRMISSPKASSQQMFGATSCPASASGLGFAVPREKSERGMANVFTTQPKPADRKSTRLNSSHSQISYAVFCLKKKNGLASVRVPVQRFQVGGSRGF